MTSLDQELADLGVIDEAPAAPAASRPVLVLPDTQQTPLARNWAKWKPEFAKAMDGGFHSIDGLEAMIFKGLAQFWPGKNAAVVTQIQTYPGERALQALWGAGDPVELVAMIPGLEAYGRLNGCTSVLVEGRHGWERVLKGAGFARWSVTLRKVL